VIRAFVLPALIEKIVELIPLLKLENSFQFKLDDLEVLCDDVCLCGAAKFVDTFCSSTAELLTVLPSFQVILQTAFSVVFCSSQRRISAGSKKLAKDQTKAEVTCRIRLILLFQKLDELSIVRCATKSGDDILPPCKRSATGQDGWVTSLHSASDSGCTHSWKTTRTLVA
jgi:hypothetical protein